MIPGDLVRFDSRNVKKEVGQTLIGLLVQYNTWEKVATVMFEGKEYRNQGFRAKPSQDWDERQEDKKVDDKQQQKELENFLKKSRSKSLEFEKTMFFGMMVLVRHWKKKYKQSFKITQVLVLFS